MLELLLLLWYHQFAYDGLLQHGTAPDEDENVDVEGEGDSGMYEEYEWAGQRRIRATTLLVGGFAGW